MLEVSELAVSYQGAIALRAVSLVVSEGKVAAVVGPNGAGKTSLVRAISGFLPGENVQVRGRVALNGARITGKPPHEIRKAGLHVVPERDKVFPRLTVRENLKVVGADRQLDKVYSYFPILEQRLNLQAGYLSGGERQMLAMGMALAGSPTCLVVDEFSLGLAPTAWQGLSRIIRDMTKREKIAVLIVEQSMSVVRRLADWIHVLSNGRIVKEGAPEEVATSSEIVQSYLGAETSIRTDVN
jgi:branched-chain amino acid transport system ATP-binding protein